MRVIFISFKAVTMTDQELMNRPLGSDFKNRAG